MLLITCVFNEFRQCRRQLINAFKTLFDTDYAYSKVEPKENFDNLKSECDNLKANFELLSRDFRGLMRARKFLIHRTTKILTERDSYYVEWTSNKSILTPRPDWNKCFHIVPEWKPLSTGKTSEQLVDILLNEITHGNTAENTDEYLSTESSDDKFPTKKLIHNRHMRRRITGLLIKDIWSTKLYVDSNLTDTTRINLADHVFEYLTKRFASEDIAIEISCNMKDACFRYRNHYEINLFWQILTGQTDEFVYHYEMKEYARVLQYLLKLCPNLSVNAFSSTILWSDLVTALGHLYPTWTDERISKLIKAAEYDVGQTFGKRNDLEFLLLFTEDDEGRVGKFLMTLRRQLQSDKDEYIEKIKDLLISYPLVSVNHFKRAVLQIDPNISEEELQRYIIWVFELNKINRDASSSNIQSAKEIKSRHFEDVVLRLEHCSCCMH